MTDEALLASINLDGTEPSLFQCDAALKRHVWPLADFKPLPAETPCRCGAETWGLGSVGQA